MKDEKYDEVKATWECLEARLLVSCRSCWWQEGGLCKDGRSPIKANDICWRYLSKRRKLEDIGFPSEKLIIVGEGRLRNKKDG